MAVTRKHAAAAAIAATLIAGAEGCVTYAYRDPVGIPTICFGHTPGVRMGDHKTLDECKALLLDDLPKYEQQVDRCIHVEMPPHRRAAMVSFTYNVGGGTLCKSSVARAMNAGHAREACDNLLRYVYARGIPLPGLKNRRVKERAECLRED
jgi:lysozyme